MSQSLHQKDALELLSAVLDPTGYIFVVGIGQDKMAKQMSFPPGDCSAAVNEAMRLSNAGSNAYFCTSTLMSDKSRKADNVHAVKVLKLDLDVEIDNAAKYASKREAIAALLTFCQQTGLPIPTTVDSGNGGHAYWLLSEALSPADGKVYSEKLSTGASSGS